MKNLIRLIFAPMVFDLLVWQVTGCKRTPSPPTEQDAVAVWHNIARTPHLRDLVSLKKTNGEVSQMNGVDVYTLYYQATVKDVVRLGNRPSGTIETYQGDFPFQWTEKGWMGPHHQVYSEH
jgi:hypothetical protein